jgi:hypothetical protein
VTDTLRDIPREITEVLNENWVPSRVVYGTDEPDGFSSVRGWAAHVAEAILAIPGIAVVELPEPDHHEPATEYTNGYVEWRYPAREYCHHRRRHDHVGALAYHQPVKGSRRRRRSLGSR